MVTAAHCVGMPKATVQVRFGEQVLPAVNAEEVKNYLKSIKGVAQPDDEMVRLAGTLFGGFNSRHMRVSGLRGQIGVVRALPGGGRDATSKITRLRLVAKGVAYPGEDFALLKLNGAKNLPTVPLGADADVQVGDELYINGFPGVITLNPAFNRTSKLFPALAQGAFNARRTTVAGVPYIQGQAPSYGGNSGGPVFDQNGKVIGSLIAGTGTTRRPRATSCRWASSRSISPVRGSSRSSRGRRCCTTRRWTTSSPAGTGRRCPSCARCGRCIRRTRTSGTTSTNTRKAIAAGKDRTPKNAR